MRASCSAPKAVRLLRKSDRREARPKVESVALVDEERQLCSAKKATILRLEQQRRPFAHPPR